MKISFIITYYNEPQWMLSECLKSVLALDLQNEEREIIVVNDGGNIIPLDEIKKLSDSIQYIYQANQGPSVARNTGLQYCTGDYIQFIDADDYILHDDYMRCVSILKDEHPDILLYNDCKDTTTDGAYYMTNNNLRVAPWGYTFLRNKTKQMFPAGIDHEDELFTPLIVLNAETLRTTKLKPYYYRQRKGSITHTKDKNKIEKMLNDTIYLIRQLNNHASTLPQKKQTALHRRIHQLCMDYLYNSWTQTHNIRTLKESTQKLRDCGLYPLPIKIYTTKYFLFATLTTFLSKTC